MCPVSCSVTRNSTVWLLLENTAACSDKGAKHPQQDICCIWIMTVTRFLCCKMPFNCQTSFFFWSAAFYPHICAPAPGHCNHPVFKWTCCVLVCYRCVTCCMWVKLTVWMCMICKWWLPVLDWSLCTEARVALGFSGPEFLCGVSVVFRTNTGLLPPHNSALKVFAPE